MFVKAVILLLLLIVLASLLTGARGAAPGRPAARSHLSRVRPLMTKVAFILLALGGALVVIHLSGCSPTNGFHAAEVKNADFGRLEALETLADPSGRRPASADFAGKVSVVFFGYTLCPDICPTTLSTMAEAMRLLGSEAERVRIWFVTVDPERDTPERLATYVSWFDPRFTGLAGDAEAIRKVAKEFRVFYSKAASDSAAGYAIDHTATSYVYDLQGRLRLLIRHGEHAPAIADDLRRLLAEK